ncbi:MAG TPA: RnfABCDGE type electron transport complex subunit D, partial [Victivallales bacterium]|nr:RnfABCDGE type electron transport complex subunit D [Victivallales bacterium]
ICFPVALTSTWAPVAEEKIGALNRWSTVSSVDSISSATPMANLKSGSLILIRDNKNQILPHQNNNQKSTYISAKDFYISELTGRLSGTMGVTSVIAILIGGLYLLFSKTASPQIIISTVLSYFILTHILYLIGIQNIPDGLTAIMGGGFLFGAFFMATDPVSAPKTNEAKIIYGIIIGTCTMIIRNFSIFNGGLMFSIIIGNMFAPILDYIVKELKNQKVNRNENN